MKINFSSGRILYILLCSGLLLIGVVAGFSGQNFIRSLKKTYIEFDDTRLVKWPAEYTIISIPSSADSGIQKAYVYKSKSEEPMPLVISLHSWSADYQQKDKMAPIVLEKDWNYIHPDFRGPNNNPRACASDLVIGDIDDCIAYGLKNFNVDSNRIYIVGGSGGGYVTLAAYMKSKYPVRSFNAWCPISDLNAWHQQTKIRDLQYAADILSCTGSSGNDLNVQEAAARSPLNWETPIEARRESILNIYAGVYDGIIGSVPITHSINFYNKIIKDLGCTDASAYVSEKEILHLLEYQIPLGEFDMIGGRETILRKSYKNVKLVIFEGKHEMLESGHEWD